MEFDDETLPITVEVSFYPSLHGCVHLQRLPSVTLHLLNLSPKSRSLRIRLPAGITEEEFGCMSVTYDSMSVLAWYDSLTLISYLQCKYKQCTDLNWIAK